MGEQHNKRRLQLCGLWLLVGCAYCLTSNVGKAQPVAQVSTPPVAQVDVVPPVAHVKVDIVPPTIQPKYPSGAVQFNDGKWYKPHPTIVGHYTPCDASEVASSAPFSNNPGVICLPTTRGIGAPNVGMNLPQANDPVLLHGYIQKGTVTERTVTNALNAGQSGDTSKLRTDTYNPVKEWIGLDGCKYQQYADGRLVICSSVG